MSLIEKIVDIETNEVTERELTKAEIKELENSRAESLAKRAEIEARLNARKEVLAKLGLTEDEAALLLP